MAGNICGDSPQSYEWRRAQYQGAAVDILKQATVHPRRERFVSKVEKKWLLYLVTVMWNVH